MRYWVYTYYYDPIPREISADLLTKVISNIALLSLELLPDVHTLKERPNEYIQIGKRPYENKEITLHSLKEVWRVDTDVF